VDGISRLSPFGFWTSFVVQSLRKHKVSKQGTVDKIKELSGTRSYFHASHSQILTAFSSDMFHVNLNGLFSVKFITHVDVIRTEVSIESGSCMFLFANLSTGTRIDEYLYCSKLCLESTCAWMEIIKSSFSCNP